MLAEQHNLGIRANPTVSCSPERAVIALTVFTKMFTTLTKAAG